MLHTRHFLVGALIVLSSLTGIGYSLPVSHVTESIPLLSSVILTTPSDEFKVREHVEETTRTAREQFITEVRSRLAETPPQVAVEVIETPTIEESTQIETAVPPVLLPEVVPVVEIPTVVEATTTVSSTSSSPIEEMVLE